LRLPSSAPPALLVACGGGGPDKSSMGAQPPPSSIYPIYPSTTQGNVSKAAAPSQSPAASFARYADGIALPDVKYTPGASFGDVTVADICDLHYTLGVRQPRFNDKVTAFTNYGISIHDRDIYQVDHLIPVSLGGSNDETNLWPQPYDEEAGAEQKDLIERQLRGLVCSNKLSLADAATPSPRTGGKPIRRI